MSNPDHPEFSAYYDATSDMFVVEFLDGAVFGPPAFDCRWGMFTHGVCADVEGEWFTGTWRRIGITGWQVYDGLTKALGYCIDKAISALRHTYPDAMSPNVTSDERWVLGKRRCEAAARLLTIHRDAIIAELIASRNRYHSTTG